MCSRRPSSTKANSPLDVQRRHGGQRWRLAPTIPRCGSALVRPVISHNGRNGQLSSHPLPANTPASPCSTARVRLHPAPYRGPIEAPCLTDSDSPCPEPPPSQIDLDLPQQPRCHLLPGRRSQLWRPDRAASSARCYMRQELQLLEAEFYTTHISQGTFQGPTLRLHL